LSDPRAPRTARNPIEVQVRLVDPLQLDSAALAEWARLEERSFESNVYLSPHFVLPAIRHLDPSHPPFMLLAERADRSRDRLCGVGLFRKEGPTWRFPLPHLSAYRSRHSYLTGILADRDLAPPVVDGFLGYLCQQGLGWHGVEFGDLAIDSGIGPLLLARAQMRGVPWYEYSRCQRAALKPTEAGEDYLEQQLSAGRRKDLRRRERRLSEQGAVEWQATHGTDLSNEHIERFLALEHTGWKGNYGTSLRSQSADAAFFRELIRRMARAGRAVITELRVADEVIASTSNLVSGNAAFAFKLGWHADYKKMAPGILNEIELVRHAPTLFGDCEYIDSGSLPGSFMEELWAGRRTLAFGALATTTLGRRALGAFNWLHRLRRTLVPARRRECSK